MKRCQGTFKFQFSQHITTQPHLKLGEQILRSDLTFTKQILTPGRVSNTNCCLNIFLSLAKKCLQTDTQLIYISIAICPGGWFVCAGGCTGYVICNILFLFFCSRDPSIFLNFLTIFSLLKAILSTLFRNNLQIGSGGGSKYVSHPKSYFVVT